MRNNLDNVNAQTKKPRYISQNEIIPVTFTPDTVAKIKKYCKDHGILKKQDFIRLTVTTSLAKAGY